MKNKEPEYGYILTNPSFREGTQELYNGIIFEKDKPYNEE